MIGALIISYVLNITAYYTFLAYASLSLAFFLVSGLALIKTPDDRDRKSIHCMHVSSSSRLLMLQPACCCFSSGSLLCSYCLWSGQRAGELEVQREKGGPLFSQANDAGSSRGVLSHAVSFSCL